MCCPQSHKHIVFFILYSKPNVKFLPASTDTKQAAIIQWCSGGRHSCTEWNGIKNLLYVQLKAWKTSGLARGDCWRTVGLRFLISLETRCTASDLTYALVVHYTAAGFTHATDNAPVEAVHCSRWTIRANEHSVLMLLYDVSSAGESCSAFQGTSLRMWEREEGNSCRFLYRYSPKINNPKHCRLE